MSPLKPEPSNSQYNGTSMSPTKLPRKKKRTLGTFPCPDCNKIFSRSDHLARHHLNHEPKEVFECEFLIYEFGSKRKCGKTFVRRDLKERHTKRHFELMNSESNKKRANQISHGRSSVSSQTTIGESPNIANSHQSPLQISNLINGDDLANGTANNQHMNTNGGSLSLASASGVQQDQIATSYHIAHMNQLPQYSLQPEQHIRQPSNLSPAPQPQFSEINNRQFINFGNNIPQSQNDILSWLFTDSPPTNVVLSSPAISTHEPLLKQQLPPTTIPINNPNSIQAQIPLRHSSMFESSNQVIPSSYNDSQITHIPEKVQEQQLTFDDQAPLTPFYHIANGSSLQMMNSLQDVNIFSNGDNPLDEVFLRNYQTQIMHNQGLNQKDVSAFFNTPANFNFSMTSTASSNSPTNTNESNTSPKDITVDSMKMNNSNSFEQMIIVHGEKHNISMNKHLFIDSLIVDSLLKALPTITRESIEDIFSNGDHKLTIEDRLSYYLSIYWLIFHPQFTILHKPSFTTKTTEPLLLISMLLIGCNYSSSSDKTQFSKERKKSPEFYFSIMIATPLRYMIFQHKDFESPVKLWVLQSLTMLEWCEKNFLSRRMHERAHVHHGTSVQLLRRSPLLGGNPTTAIKVSHSNSGSNTSAGEEESDGTSNEISATKDGDTSDYDLFVKWIESESMKRVTFMTFYLDIIDYIKFRHNPQILFYQLQLLNLPCDDENLWESTEVNGSFRKIVKRQKKLQEQLNGNGKRKSPIKIRNGESFLSGLKRLLKSDKHTEPKSKLKVSLFTKKILFGGLISIMYQMQQMDLQYNTPVLISNGIAQNSNQKSKIWKEILTKAFDNWNIEVNESCSTSNREKGSSIFQTINPSQCRFPMYHLTQIIGISDIDHYDIAIFGGSPANMSVNATMKDHYIVQRKLNNMWLKNSTSNKRSISELINLKSVIHCYLLLWEMMLKPVDDNNEMINPYIDWDVNRDYFDSMYAISIAILVLWSYAFSTCGLESQRFNDTDNIKIYESYEKLMELSAEGGYQYLNRIRQEFLTNLRKDNLHHMFSIHPFNLYNKEHTPHEILSKYCDLLPSISNKQNISGLCFLIGTKLLSSQWEVIRENAKLILNCGFRSIGKKDILCLDLFDNDFDD